MRLKPAAAGRPKEKPTEQHVCHSQTDKQTHPPCSQQQGGADGLNPDRRDWFQTWITSDQD